MPYKDKRRQLEFMREWRKNNPTYIKNWFKDHPNKNKEYIFRNRDKYEARWAVKKAVKSGTLKKLGCEVCGAIKTEAHHIDYTKPLIVRWLCRVHHEECHLGTRN